MPKSKTPLIEVIAWKKNKLSILDNDAYFYLEQDNWNDQGFYTSYHLHASSLLTQNTKPLMIGHLRILKAGQEIGDMFLLPKGPTNGLNEDFCSMGTSLDYYERISQLPINYSNQILIALRDVIIFPEIKEGFEDEPGFDNSLMRNISIDDEMFEMAPMMIERDFHKLLDLKLSFKFSIPELKYPIDFKFDSSKSEYKNYSLPNRIVAIIGRNGSGKSTLLSRISRVAFSSATVRRNVYLQRVGQLQPPGLGFPRIIVLSYSAFDAFNTPGIYKRDKETIVDEMKNGLGRYVFCGIRDIVTELEAILPDLDTDSEGKLSRREILRDRIENTILKSIADLGREFVKNLLIARDTKQEKLLSKVFSILSEETSMHNMFKEDFINDPDELNHEFFMRLSTGHKYVIHSVTSIIAYTAPRSLLLFDEPETHLHPPILAALMKAIRYILSKKNSFMIVATHSPVVLQETLREHVYVVRRQGQEMSIEQPDLETFGENIGILTQVAFGLSSEATDFHSTLDDLIKEATQDFFLEKPTPMELLERIESLFELGLSMQARSYILSKIYRK